MTDLDLFHASSSEGAGTAPGSGSVSSAGEGAQGDAVDRHAPLAARMRPRTLDDVRGQEQLLGRGKAIRAMLDGGKVASMILWGPPGSGKTTLARIIADVSGTAFVPFSAVTEGVARVREIIAEAGTRRQATGRQTILFCDEIHRFNKAQQDVLLPHIERGTVRFIGATTHNPYFYINSPLVSRSQIFQLEPIEASDLRI
ncbi:MAG: AAA family ATPase, partial [Longimicrobiales bacterium]